MNRWIGIWCLVLGLFSSAQAAIIPADRIIDWSQVGIPGGIPDRPVCRTMSAGATMESIQSVLDSTSCINGTVFLPAGVYSITGSLTIPSNVTLRGAGPGRTILNALGQGDGVVQFGSGPSVDINASVSITNGATAGSSQITLQKLPTGLTSGDYLLITELNDPSFVTSTGDEGVCGWCDQWGGIRSLGQIVEITAVNGNIVQFKPSLYRTYARTPLATPVPIDAKNAGAEYFTVYANNTGYRTNFLMYGTAYCWLKGVEGNYADGDHVEIHSGYRNEVRDSYFHDGFSHGPGTTDDDLILGVKTNGTLVENNIFTRLHVSIMLNWGTSGNVIAYNYSDHDFADTASNATFGDFDLHGAHPAFNLWEGNIGNRFAPDSTWGSSSHGVVLRNWFKAANFSMNPLFGRGPTDPANGWWTFQTDYAVDLHWTAQYYSLVGNVIGSSTMLQLNTNGHLGPYPVPWGIQDPLPPVYMAVYPDPVTYDNNTYGYTIGYGESGFTAAPGFDAYHTAIIHGNWDIITGTTHWDASIADQNIPTSLYLVSQPKWWTTPWGTPAWPPIGPEVTGGFAESLGHAYKIPAMLCYENQNLLTGGAFDPTGCYGTTTASSPGTPIIPTGSGTNATTQFLPFKNVFDPTKDSLEIKYTVNGEGTLIVYDRQGSEVKKLDLRGNNQTLWDGRNSQGQIVASGTYILILKADKTIKKKVVVVK